MHVISPIKFAKELLLLLLHKETIHNNKSWTIDPFFSLPIPFFFLFTDTLRENLFIVCFEVWNEGHPPLRLIFKIADEIGTCLTAQRGVLVRLVIMHVTFLNSKQKHNSRNGKWRTESGSH